MYVKFKKNHPSGIKKGSCAEVDHAAATKWVDAGYVNEITKEDHNDFVLLKRKEAKQKIEDDQSKSLEVEADRLNKELEEEETKTKKE